MELNIDSDKDITNFCLWLIPKIKEYFVNSIDDRKLEKYNIYLNANKIVLFDYSEKRLISARSILIGAIYNLHLKHNLNHYVIEINPNSTIPSTSAKFTDIVKLINFGNMSLQGYQIVSDTMNYFANNINNYYNSYLEEIEE